MATQQPATHRQGLDTPAYHHRGKRRRITIQEFYLAFVIVDRTEAAIGVFCGRLSTKPGTNEDIQRIFHNRRVFLGDGKRLSDHDPKEQRRIRQGLKSIGYNLVPGSWTVWRVDMAALVEFRRALARSRRKTFTVSDFPLMAS